MELTAAYKETELGALPTDWDALPIGEVCRLVNGRGFKPYEWRSSGLPIIRIQNLNGSDDFNYFSGQYDPKIFVRHGQLLFAWSGSRGTSFGPHIWKGGDALLNYHTWKVVPNHNKVRQDFLFHALRYLTAFIEDRAHGASALVHTQKWEMEKFQIAIPRRESEQRAIAEALSDADALVGALDRLIAKKRDLKQAAMQQLLTGKTRLPGFSGAWEVKRLERLGSFLKGCGVRRDEAQSGELPCVRYGELYTIHHDVVRSFASRISRAVAATARRVTRGDILFAGSGETKEEIGKCAAIVHDVEAYAGGDIVILRLHEGNPTFFGYLMNMPSVVRQKANLGQGDAVVHISATALASVEVFVPEPAEQSAIAAIISDMDAEIESLEARRAKTALLKQGMMQELLTGRTRLV